MSSKSTAFGSWDQDPAASMAGSDALRRYRSYASSFFGGSGVSVTELNTLLSRFAQMQQMMKKMGKFQKMMARMGGGLPGMLRR